MSPVSHELIGGPAATRAGICAVFGDVMRRVGPVSSVYFIHATILTGRYRIRFVQSATVTRNERMMQDRPESPLRSSGQRRGDQHQEATQAPSCVTTRSGSSFALRTAGDNPRPVGLKVRANDEFNTLDAGVCRLEDARIARDDLAVHRLALRWSIPSTTETEIGTRELRALEILYEAGRTRRGLPDKFYRAWATSTPRVVKDGDPAPDQIDRRGRTTSQVARVTVGQGSRPRKHPPKGGKPMPSVQAERRIEKRPTASGRHAGTTSRRRAFRGGFDTKTAAREFVDGKVDEVDGTTPRRRLHHPAPADADTRRARRRVPGSAPGRGEHAADPRRTTEVRARRSRPRRHRQVARPSH